ncbi:hypothetical protein [Phytohabitans aurantiacus]|uniref:Uncharacterized protein n=1 Tax=Phytohabitans aurantiacus TaxID=3016789 RepID=A0ABQ5R310_9ACTN|nr:hypothetical protein [Phytohabitans aurantiacus]GLH99975.1 hypothetical protein Pa4123_52510 [Phytohabitans aurantiacus]
MIPHAIRQQPPGFEAAPTLSRFSVTGRRYRSRGGQRVALVHGTDGVTLTSTQGPATVLFDQCTAMLRYADGGRHLYGIDGIPVQVEPTFFVIPTAALTRIDDAVPANAIVDLPAREPANIPKPSRLAGLRARLRAPSMLWRIPPDRFTFLRGGGGSYLLTIALLGALATLFPLGIALDQPTLGAAGMMCGVALIWRWHRNDYW